MALANPKVGNELNEDQLYDTTIGYDEESELKFAPGLTKIEKRMANAIYKIFNGLWGLCIVVGLPGTGKDLFGNKLSHQIKRFFPWKRIMRDERPRKLYGKYAGLFNDEVLSDELAKMKLMAKGSGLSNYGLMLEKAADDWVTKQGMVMLKNSVLYLTEFWNYCYKREGMNPMNKTMGAIHKIKRHLDCLILGTVQQVEDLDRFTCLPFVDWQVTCTKSASNPTKFIYFVSKVKWDRRLQVLTKVGSPTPIVFDAGKPRSYLGDGKIIVKKPDYRPETEEERVVLTVLNAGVTNYEQLVEVLYTDGDMCEEEVLSTLKELKFRRNKRVIDYPCDFGLYNSKSAPNLRTSLKVEE